MENPLGRTEAISERIKIQYDEAKEKGHKHVGLFVLSIPMYMPLDPEYIKNIMSRDFDHFLDRGMYYNEKSDPLSAHLFAIEGAKWRNLRMKITPTFTSGKMKMMFQALLECADQLKQFMDKTDNEPVNIKDVLGRFTTDIIGFCAFGLNYNSFEDPNSEFRKHLKRVFHNTKFEALKGFFAFGVPEFSRSVGLHLTPKEVSKYIMDVIKDTVEFREKNNFKRNEFLQILLNLKDDDEDECQHDGKSLTMDELAAEAFLFLLAGYETSFTTITFCLFELAQNPDIQQKVRDEINSVLEKHDGNITYDGTMEMKYMGQVIDGLRFGVMQTKVGLTILLRNYIVSLNNKTNIPLKYNPASFITATLGDILLNVKSV